MIILEGCDNAGKSTLLKQLLELDPSLRVLKRDRFKPERGETIGTSYLNALLPPPDGDRQAHAHSIADRFLASECIYGALFRGGCRMTPNEHFLIKTTLLSYGALVVWCDPGPYNVRKGWENREQLYNKDPLAIWAAYDTRLSKIFFPIPIWKYDWSSPSATKDRETIIQLHHERMQQYALDLSWPVVGCETSSR